MANPPFKVREAKRINAELGQNALPEGFVAIPAMNHEYGNLNCFNGYSCPRVDAVKSNNYLDEAFFNDYVHEYEAIREPIAAALGIPEHDM